MRQASPEIEYANLTASGFRKYVKVIASMKTRYYAQPFLLGLLALATIPLLSPIPMLAAGAARPISVRIGTFDLKTVEANCPESPEAYALRTKLEKEVRAGMGGGEPRLDKKPKTHKQIEEIQESADRLRQEVNHKQLALIQAVIQGRQEQTRDIAATVENVAAMHSLDLVFDRAGVFVGNLSDCEDLTQEVIKELAAMRWEVPSVGFIETFPPITGDFLFCQTDEGDKAFEQGQFAESIKQYDIAFKSNHRPDQQSAILAKEAWAFCLSGNFQQAQAKVRTAIEIVRTDFRSGTLQRCLQLLQGRIYFESGGYDKASDTFNNIDIIDKRAFGDSPAKQSLLASLWLNKEISQFQSTQREFLRNTPNMRECACKDHPSKSIFQGLACRGTDSEAMTELDQNLEGLQLANANFDSEHWKTSILANSNYRLKALHSLLKDHSLISKTKEQVRASLGPPSFAERSTVYEDFFPLCAQRPRPVGHVHLDISRSNPGEIPRVQPFDSVWCLVVTYDVNGIVASLRLSIIHHALLVRFSNDDVFRMLP